MSVSFHSKVLIPGTATFSWATDGASCITDALPEVTVGDAPTFSQPVEGAAPLLATFPDGYQFSFYPDTDTDAAAEARMLMERYDLPDDVVGPMSAIAATTGGLVIEVTGDNDMSGSDDHFNEFLFASEAFQHLGGSLAVYDTESDTWPRRDETPTPIVAVAPPSVPTEPAVASRPWWRRLMG